METLSFNHFSNHFDAAHVTLASDYDYDTGYIRGNSLKI